VPGPLYQFLQQDHERLDDLLKRSVAGSPAVELGPYALFRAGLLRHIGMEEKILLPTARRLRDGEPLPIAKRLRADHAALASLLVPTPTRDIIATIRDILAEHNPLEEGAGGMYEVFERLAAAELEALIARLHAAPEVTVAPHFDGPRVQAHIEKLLRDRSESNRGDGTGSS